MRCHPGTKPQNSTESGTISGCAKVVECLKGAPFAHRRSGFCGAHSTVAPGLAHVKLMRLPRRHASGVSMPGETPPVVSEDCLYLTSGPGESAGAHSSDRLEYGGVTSKIGLMPLYWATARAQRRARVTSRIDWPAWLPCASELTASPAPLVRELRLMDRSPRSNGFRETCSLGRPKNVTIAGQFLRIIWSASSMASPLAKGLFRPHRRERRLFEPLQLAPSSWLANAEPTGEVRRSLVDVAPATPTAAGKRAHRQRRRHCPPVIEPYVLPFCLTKRFPSGQHNDVPSSWVEREEARH